MALDDVDRAGFELVEGRGRDVRSVRQHDDARRIRAIEPGRHDARFEAQAVFDVSTRERARRGELYERARRVGPLLGADELERAPARVALVGVLASRQPLCTRVEDASAANDGPTTRIDGEAPQDETEPAEARERRFERELRETRRNRVNPRRGSIGADVDHRRAAVFESILEAGYRAERDVDAITDRKSGVRRDDVAATDARRFDAREVDGDARRRLHGTDRLAVHLQAAATALSRAVRAMDVSRRPDLQAPARQRARHDRSCALDGEN